MTQFGGEKQFLKLNISEQLHQGCARNYQEIPFLIKILSAVTCLAKRTGTTFQIKTVAFKKHLSLAVLYKWLFVYMQ